MKKVSLYHSQKNERDAEKWGETVFPYIKRPKEISNFTDKTILLGGVTGNYR